MSQTPLPTPSQTLPYQSAPVYVPPPENPTITGIGTAISAFVVIMLVGLGVLVLLGMVGFVLFVIAWGARI